jgi:hypothetical protein
MRTFALTPQPYKFHELNPNGGVLATSHAVTVAAAANTAKNAKRMAAVFMIDASQPAQ